MTENSGRNEPLKIKGLADPLTAAEQEAYARSIMSDAAPPAAVAPAEREREHAPPTADDVKDCERAVAQLIWLAREGREADAEEYGEQVMMLYKDAIRAAGGAAALADGGEGAK